MEKYMISFKAHAISFLARMSTGTSTKQQNIQKEVVVQKDLLNNIILTPNICSFAPALDAEKR